MKIPYVDLSAQYQRHKSELDEAVLKVLESGHYIGGPEIEAFEANFAVFTGARYVISVANGTDALILAMKALDIGPGDEVITVPNSWVSSASTIALIGATPVFVDVGNDLNLDPTLLEAAITERTKAIIPVHLTGKPARMDQIIAIARQYNLKVIEDAAQAVGARSRDRSCGTIGDIGCFSLHPLKNLNSCGDAGVMTTNSSELYQKLVLIGKHGMPDRNTVFFWGYNSRLDAIQAAILNVRLRYLEDVLEKRRFNASLYRELLDGIVETPQETDGDLHGYHLFVIQCDERDRLQSFLQEKGIGTAIHYPTPIHLQPAAEYLGYRRGDLPVAEGQAERILSLPVSEIVGEKEIKCVADSIKRFYNS